MLSSLKALSDRVHDDLGFFVESDEQAPSFRSGLFDPTLKWFMLMMGVSKENIVVSDYATYAYWLSQDDRFDA